MQIAQNAYTRPYFRPQFHISITFEIHFAKFHLTTNLNYDNVISVVDFYTKKGDI
jgi:hypothetical protein